MKKALQISIAKTLFTVEEDAYSALDSYLASVKAHFVTTEGHEEIVSDIENRIAEQLIESKEKIVTLATVNKIIDRIGHVEDFGDEGAHEQAKKSGAGSTHQNGKQNADETTNKKLYRSTDDVVIAGIASGLAAYFGIDTVVVRLLFLLFTFVSGFGLFLYIILWLIIPEAKTASQKLEMTGSPVNLATLSETVRERVDELQKKHPGGFQRLIALPFRIIGKILYVIASIIGPVARIIIGGGLTVAAILALIGVILMSGFLISGDFLIDYSVPLQALLPAALQWLVIGMATLAAAIPLIFILLAGVGVLQKRSVITTPVGLTLLGIWFVTIFACGFGAAKAVANYEKITQNLPEYQITTLPVPLTGSFAAIDITDGTNLTIIEGTSTSLTANGRIRDIERIDARVENDTLTIGRKPSEHTSCFFCSSRSIALTLVTPTISKMTVGYGSFVQSTKFPQTEALEMILKHGTYANLSLSLDTLNVVLLNGSRLTLNGSATTLQANLKHGSSLDALKLTTADTEITALHGSTAEITATKTLKADAKHGSVIEYSGKPELTKETAHGSVIQSASEFEDME